MAEPPKEMAEETKPTEESASVPPPKQMRSIVLTGFGGVKMLKCQQKAEPTANEGDVLIRVKAW